MGDHGTKSYPLGVCSLICVLIVEKLYEPLKRTLNHIHERRTS